MRFLIPLIVSIIGLFAFFIILRRWRIKKKEEQIKKLKEDFNETKKEKEEVSEGNKKILKNLADRIERAFEEGEDSVRLSVREDVTINIETKDVISLELPEYTLYKSFRSARFEELEKTDGEVDLYFIR